MKHFFTSSRGHQLEVRESGRSHKLFLIINGKQTRIDDQPLKPAIVTALLQEIIKLKLETREAWHVAAQNERNSSEYEDKLSELLDGFDDTCSPI